MKILCVHGVGNHQADTRWQDDWRKSIRCGTDGLFNEGDVTVTFFEYDDFFDAAQLNTWTVLEAIGKLVGSGIVHGVGGLFRSRRAAGRGLAGTLRWTAGMVAQWVENEALRTQLRAQFLQDLRKHTPDVICAHSLGSLVAYDALVADQTDATIDKAPVLVTFGSQIGNPFVRSSFGGRLTEPAAKQWFHLYNEYDDVFTSRIRLHSERFAEVDTPFDDPGPLDHDATSYLNHVGTRDTVWRSIAAAREAVPRGPGLDVLAASPIRKSFAAPVVRTTPERRALIVGINDYPDPTMRLDGCINDAFLMSELLQEAGFEAAGIRMVLNERATADAVRERLEWLLESPGSGSEHVLYFSGHGARLPGYGVHEVVDHVDECLVTHDFDWTAQHAISDNEFLELYSQLPYDARFLAIFDCCHSGGITRSGAPKVRGLNPPDDIRHRLMRWDARDGSWVPRSIEPVMNTPELGDRAVEWCGDDGTVVRIGRGAQVRPRSRVDFNDARKRYGHEGPYMPLVLMACQEQEYAYEYRHGVTSYGAFTYGLAAELRRRRRKPPTYEGLVRAVARRLRRLSFDQRPEIAGPTVWKQADIPW